MTRKIIEIKFTEQDRLNVINALDSLEDTPLSMHDELLESAIEKAWERKGKEAEQAMEANRNGVYEVSSTFYQPTTVIVNIDEGMQVAATVKARGIRRPYVKELITPKTRKLYHHESGIVGLMEETNGLYKVVRFPLRLLRELGMSAVTEFYPEIEDGLEFQPSEREGVSAAIEGDLSYKEVLMVDFTRDAREIDEMMKKASESFGEKALRVAVFLRRKYEKSESEIEDFRTAGDVSRFYEELEHTSWDFSIKVVAYSHILDYMGVMARIYSDASVTKPERRQIFEMRIPVDLVKHIKRMGYETKIGPVDQFLQNDRMDLGNLEFGMEIVECPSVQLVGDMVYRRACQSSQEYEVLKEEIDDLGMKYLDQRMKHLRVIG